MVQLSLVPSPMEPLVPFESDPNFDNGPLIREYGLADIPLPFGAFSFTPPITLQDGTGFNLTGKGCPDTLRGQGAWYEGTGRKATVLIANHAAVGSYTGPLFDFVSFSRVNFAKLGIYGRPQPDNNFEIAPCTAIQIRDLGTPHTNAGEYDFFQVGLYGMQRGWYFAPGTHADWVRVRQGQIKDVNQPYVMDEDQSVDHVVELLLKGPGDAVVWAKRGGRAQFKITGTREWNTILRLGDETQNTGPTNNNGCYRVLYWSDGGDTIQNLIEERTTNNPAHVIFEYWEAAGANVINPVLKLNGNSYIETHRYYPGLTGPSPPATPWGHEVTVW